MTTSEMSSGNNNSNNNNSNNNNNNNNKNANNNTASVNGGVFHLRIKSFKDVEIAVPSGSVVAHVKQQVRAALLGPGSGGGGSGGGGSGGGGGGGGGGDDNDTDNDRRYLRLICKGRLLLPDDHPISDFNVQNGDVVHAVLAPLPSSTTTTTTSTSPSSRRQPQRRRRRRTRPNNIRRNGTIVGPGGRVTRAPPTLGNYGDGDDDDTSSDDESDYEYDDEDDEDDEEENGGGGGGGDVEAGRTTTTTTTRRISRRRRGFDRLRELDNGYLLPQTRLPRSEVQAIRAYFSRQVDRYQAQHPDAHMEEGDVLLRRRLFEEDWMAQQVPTSEFRLNLNQNMTLMRLAALQQNGRGGGMMMMSGTTGGGGGAGIGYNPTNASNAYYGSLTAGTDRDFIWGFMLGFFVGFVMLVWVWMPTVPHKQKIGILTGISFQLALNVLVEPPPPSDLDLDEQVDGSAGGGASGDYEMED